MILTATCYTQAAAAVFALVEIATASEEKQGENIENLEVCKTFSNLEYGATGMNGAQNMYFCELKLQYIPS